VLRGDAAVGAGRERERRQLQAQRGVVGQAHQAVQVRAQEAQPQALRARIVDRRGRRSSTRAR